MPMTRLPLRLSLLVTLCCFNTAAWAAAPRQDFAPWLQALQDEAVSKGISPITVHEVLDNILPDARVLELDQKQPENTLTFATYSKNILSADRIKTGKILMRKYSKTLKKISANTGVPPQIIVALWGIESAFGKNMGGFSTLEGLVTLAYDGRRADYFRSEVFQALRMIDQDHISPDDMTGSWAGAMGQSQFMPTTYLHYAVDYNHDGRRDIWHTTSDVLASIANYVAKGCNWERGIPWGYEVELTQPVDTALISMKGNYIFRTPQEWSALGVHRLHGKMSVAKELALIHPDGDNGRSFLVSHNFRAIMTWNRSSYFATTVGLLGDRLR